MIKGRRVVLDNNGRVALHRGTSFGDTLQNGNPFDTAIEWLLVGLLAFMPFAFGVVHAWSEEVVIVLSGAIVICFLLKLVYHRDQGIIWTWAYVPLGVFLLIPILQLIALPATLVSIVSPNTAVLKTELLGDLPNADALLKSMPLSFYPNATKHDLRLVLAVAAVFVVVLNVFRRPDQIKRLLMAITLICGIIAMITLAQNLFGNEKIYWFVSTYGQALSGPFVNHSNYGQFMNLSVGAALGLLLVRLHEGFAGKKITPAVISEYISSGSSKSLWFLVAIMSLGVATVFISLTRGGMVSMLIAITFTTLLLAWRRSLKGSGWIIMLMALGAFICVIYIGFDAVYDQLATLRGLHEAEGGRWQIVKDIVVAWTKFPLLGTGLGTHAVVYPMFDRSTIPALAYHAENEYAQVIEEAGLVGLTSLVIFGIIVWANYGRSIRPAPIRHESKTNSWGANLPIRSAAYGLGFGILAILIHSLSDFGQHLPANAFLSAVFCALLLALARQGEKETHAKRTVTLFGKFKVLRTALRTVVLLGVSGTWVWALIGADNARIAEAHWQRAVVTEKGLVDRNWQGTDAEYADLISHASAAASHQPENIEYQHWLNVYRWHSIGNITDPNTGDIIIPENLMPSVLDIVREFHNARTLCPTYGPIYSMVGRIEKFILGDNSGAKRIRKGFRLAPCDPIACFVAGYLDVSEGKYEDCIEKFQKAVQLDGRLFKNVVDIYINHLSRPHLAMTAAGDSIGRLSHVANVLEDMQYNDLAEQTREKMKHLLEAECSRPDAPVSALALLAHIYRKQEDNEAAIEYYRRALVLEYGQFHWRLELARLLVEMGKIREAMREARICLQLRPQSKEAEKLVADLSVYPAVFNEENTGP